MDEKGCSIGSLFEPVDFTSLAVCLNDGEEPVSCGRVPADQADPGNGYFQDYFK
jgi:hypothetical protein